MDIANSAQLFAEAQGYIPGGVNSPVRSFKSVGGIPLSLSPQRTARKTSTAPWRWRNLHLESYRALPSTAT